MIKEKKNLFILAITLYNLFVLAVVFYILSRRSLYSTIYTHPLPTLLVTLSLGILFGILVVIPVARETSRQATAGRIPGKLLVWVPFVIGYLSMGSLYESINSLYNSISFLHDLSIDISNYIRNVSVILSSDVLWIFISTFLSVGSLGISISTIIIRSRYPTIIPYISEEASR